MAHEEPPRSHGMNVPRKGDFICLKVPRFQVHPDKDRQRSLSIDRYLVAEADRLKNSFSVLITGDAAETSALWYEACHIATALEVAESRKRLATFTDVQSAAVREHARRTALVRVRRWVLHLCAKIGARDAKAYAEIEQVRARVDNPTAWNNDAFLDLMNAHEDAMKEQNRT
jgi:hypothetical protein